jgi:F-type H+-transporting ATPase subunit b
LQYEFCLENGAKSTITGLTRFGILDTGKFEFRALGVAVEINATILVQIFLLVALLLWLSPTIFAPIMRLFEERERRIIGAQADAARMSQEALLKTQALDDKFDKERLDARQVLAKLKSASDSEQAKALEEIRKHAKERLHKAELDLHVEEERVRSELALLTNDMADEIVKALMAKKKPKMESQGEALTM